MSKRTVKRPFTLSVEQDRDLHQISTQTGIPVAQLVRSGIDRELIAHGIDATAHDIHPGGYHGRRETEAVPAERSTE